MCLEQFIPQQPLDIMSKKRNSLVEVSIRKLLKPDATVFIKSELPYKSVLWKVFPMFQWFMTIVGGVSLSSRNAVPLTCSYGYASWYRVNM